MTGKRRDLGFHPVQLAMPRLSELMVATSRNKLRSVLKEMLVQENSGTPFTELPIKIIINSTIVLIFNIFPRLSFKIAGSVFGE